jgi:hypothetical protein
MLKQGQFQKTITEAITTADPIDQAAYRCLPIIGRTDQRRAGSKSRMEEGLVEMVEESITATQDENSDRNTEQISDAETEMEELRNRGHSRGGGESRRSLNRQTKMTSCRRQ